MRSLALVCIASLSLAACTPPEHYPDTVAGEKMMAFDKCIEKTATTMRDAKVIEACQKWSQEITSGSRTKREAAEATSQSTS